MSTKSLTTQFDFPTKLQVQEHNLDKLARLNTGPNPQKTCRLDATHTPMNLSALGRRQKTDEMMGLESSLYLARGAKIMITQNVWTEQGLTNGSTGTVKHFIFEKNVGPPNLPQSIIILMDPGYNGPHITGLPGHIALNSVMSWKETDKGNIERTKFPLTLAFAVTVHKTQGLLQHVYLIV